MTAERTKADVAQQKSEGFWAKVAQHPLAFPKQAICDYFMGHEGALLAVTTAGVAAGVLLLVWFLVFSGLNEPVQFIYAGF
ncbi:MAG: hypothetical protein ACI4B6_02220 [Atopobiaceae bacterium]